jgi:hypothetical protein
MRIPEKSFSRADQSFAVDHPLFQTGTNDFRDTESQRAFGAPISRSRRGRRADANRVGTFTQKDHNKEEDVEAILN